MTVLIRFQVNKRVEHALKRRHPWIYRNQCSSALEAIPVGSFVRVVGTDNHFLGVGLYDPLSAIAIRVFSWEDIAPDPDYFKAKLLQAYERRQKFLPTYQTNAFRWVHGETDSLPGLTIDVYAHAAVVHFYLPSWKQHLEDVITETAQKIGLQLFEQAAQEPIAFNEAGRRYFAYPLTGLKSGFFLDLREVRLFMGKAVKAGDSVLNLFANDGALSALACAHGAKRVISVERHAVGMTHAQQLFREWAIAFDPSTWIVGDVWDYLEKQAPMPSYDLAIIDPPSLASSAPHLKNAEASWKRLHTHTLQLLKPQCHVISICCSERITKTMQIEWTLAAAKASGRRIELVSQLPGNFDHPELRELPERNYFRALVWQLI